MNILDISSNDYNYSVDKHILSLINNKSNIIFNFIKKWLLLKNIKTNIINNKIYIQNLPSVIDTYDYYNNNYKSVIEILEMSKFKYCESNKNYDHFFKFLKSILKKINYSLLVKNNYIIIKSRW